MRSGPRDVFGGLSTLSHDRTAGSALLRRRNLAPLASGSRSQNDRCFLGGIVARVQETASTQLVLQHRPFRVELGDL